MIGSNALPDVIAGPWRAVLVLGVTEILAWGAIFYPPVLTVPLIAHERGWSMTFAMGGFSLAFGRAGIDAATVVAIGALFGPAQVAARICELMFARSIHPLPIARFAVALLLAAFALMALFGLTAAVAASFAVMFGMANGLLTIARGAVPLALFGAAGYGHLVGRIGGPYLVMQAIAPLALAFVAERSCDAAVLAVAAAFATIAFIAFAAVRRPKDIAR